MTGETDNSQEAIIKEAVRQFAEAHLRGERPDIGEFVKMYPSLDCEIREGISHLQMINKLFDTLGQPDPSEFADPVDAQTLIGQKVGSFEIVEMIGRGGMGVVYLARDTRLKRTVAIKSIPTALTQDATTRTRFKREGELLAALSHPSIAVIHDIIEQDDGTDYLVLEYVPGDTLAERMARAPLALEEALSIGQQIAEAVAAAHGQGIVHRDLKPGNIKITPEGRVKVLDFGLAKSSDGAGKDPEFTATEPGHIIGTPAYMSPEQARAQATDQRTDIWSFGCILYEMLTGRPAFAGKTVTDTLAHIIDREPDWELLPHKTPENMCALLRHCLDKDQNRRFNNITDIGIQISDALGKPGASPEPAVSPRVKRAAIVVGAIVVLALLVLGVWHILRKQTALSQPRITLVVLPFENTGPGEGWFADGLTDEIRTRLGYIHGLTVIAKQSVITFKNMGMPPQTAKEHSLDYFLKGTVQCERPSDPNSQVIIRVQLVNAADNAQVWQKRFNGNMSSVFQLQSDVAEEVALELDIRLLEPERKALAYGYIDNSEAYACFVRSNQHLGEGEEGNAQAIKLLEKAVKLEPNYAEAHARLSNALINMYWLHGRNQEYLPRAKQHADRALELAPDLPWAHNVLGRYYYQGFFDYEKALKQFEIARKSRPNSAGVLHWVGAAQKRQGRVEEALVTLKRASELNPLSPRSLRIIAATLKFLRRYAEAEAYLDQVIRLKPDSPGNYVEKAWMRILQGNTEGARIVLEEALLKVSEDKNSYVYYFLITLDLYDRDYAEALRKQSSKSPDLDILAMFIPNELRRAEIYGYMGEKELARQWYERAINILEMKIAENPSVSRYHSTLGMAYAGLGDKAKAIEIGERGRNMLPVTKDAMDGPQRVEDLARIYVMVDEYDRAVEKLAYLLSIPSEVSKPYLRLDPVWKPLYDLPRFKRLVGEE